MLIGLSLHPQLINTALGSQGVPVGWSPCVAAQSVLVLGASNCAPKISFQFILALSTTCFVSSGKCSPSRVAGAYSVLPGFHLGGGAFTSFWKIPKKYYVHVPRNLGICAISRLRCAFLESGKCVPISRLRTQSWDCAVRLCNLEIARAQFANIMG